MIPETYISFLRRWFWLLVIGLIVGIGAGIAFPASTSHTAYVSTAILDVTGNSPLAGSSGATDQALRERAAALAHEAVTAPVLEAVSKDMPNNLSLDAKKLGGMITVSNVIDSSPMRIVVQTNSYTDQQTIVSTLTSYFTHDLQINVTADSPAEAKLIAQSVIQRFTEQTATAEADEVTARLSELSQSVQSVESELDLLDQEQSQLVINGQANSTAWVAGADKVDEARSVYRDLYQQYITLKYQGTPTVGQLFTLPDPESIEVNEVSSYHISTRNAALLGGIGGLVLAWFVAGLIDFSRRRLRED